MTWEGKRSQKTGDAEGEGGNEKTGGKYGIFSSCCGGGHGTTTIIENLRR
jgi:acetyl-CoA acetyltransferase